MFPPKPASNKTTGGIQATVMIFQALHSKKNMANSVGWPSKVNSCPARLKYKSLSIHVLVIHVQLRHTSSRVLQRCREGKAQECHFLGTKKISVWDCDVNLDSSCKSVQMISDFKFKIQGITPTITATTSYIYTYLYIPSTFCWHDTGTKFSQAI